MTFIAFLLITSVSIFFHQVYFSYTNWKSELHPLLPKNNRKPCKNNKQDLWHQQGVGDKGVIEVKEVNEGNQHSKVDRKVEHNVYPAGKMPNHFLIEKQNARRLRLYNKKESNKIKLDNHELIHENLDANDKERRNLSHAQKQLQLITSGLTAYQYIEYFFTLRLEHVIDKTIQLFVYLWYRLNGYLDFTPNDHQSQTELCRLIWNTSLVTGYEGIEFNDDSQECYVFRYLDYEAVHGDSKIYKFDLIEVQMPISSMVFSTSANNKGDLVEARCTIYVIPGSDGEDENKKEKCRQKETVENMYAVFYFGLLSEWLHPRIHALAAWISMYKFRGGVFEKMHIYNTTINDCSSSAAISLDSTTCPLVKSSLSNVISNGMWSHQHLVNDLIKANRLVHFIHHGRKVIKHTLKDMEININPEVYVAGSILHSLDHILLYQHTSFTRLLKSDKYGIDATMFAFLFINCTRGYIVDTRMSNQREPFIKEIYLQLSYLDKEYADLSHYCISW